MNASPMTEYCPYADREVPRSEISPEHIIPMTLGGTLDFSVRVSREMNHRLGSDVDGRFARQSFIQAFRIKYGLVGHHGNEPKIRSRVEHDFPPVGRERVDVTIKASGITHKILPTIERPTENTAYLFGDLAELQKMLQAEEERARKVGKQIRVFASGERTTDAPESTEITGDPAICARFFAKVAFASFRRAFGRWTPDPTLMSTLRRIFAEDGIDSDSRWIGLVEMMKAPEPGEVLAIERLFPESHTVWLTFSGEGAVAYVSVFGVLAAKVRLARPGTVSIVPLDNVMVTNYVKSGFGEYPGQRIGALLGLPVSPERFYLTTVPGEWFGNRDDVTAII